MSRNKLIFIIYAIPTILLAVPYTSYAINSYTGYTALIILAIIITIETKSHDILINNFVNNIKYNKSAYLTIIFYTIYAFFSTILSSKSEKSVFLIANQIMIVFSMLFSSTITCNKDNFDKFVFILVSSLGVQSFFLIEISYTDPNLLRSVVNDPTWNMGNQAFFGALAILIPAIITLRKNYTGIKNYIYQLATASIIVSILISSFATPIGLLLIGVTIYFFLNSLKNLNNFGINIFKLITLLLTIFAISSTINEIELFESVTYRFTNFIEDPKSGGYSGKEVDEGSRYLLILKSWDVFIDHIFFGSLEGNIRTNDLLGQHSSAIDVLGAYGIIGGAPLWIFNFLILKNLYTKYRINKSSINSAFLACAITYVVGGLFNPVWEGVYPWLLILFTNPFEKIQRK